ncbi:MAG: ATP-binding cassette domain-containing protein [Kiritimatiellae bacterium]|nr:ATP-binding cassette domain-containing protein [Kiritimatiellia bacterium]
MLKLENVTLLYAPNRGIQEASLSVEPGEVIGVVGGNGVGKSTLLGLIAAALVPQYGRVTLSLAGIGGRVRRLQSDIGIGYRRHVGYLTESAPVYGELTVKHYLAFRARLHGVGLFRLRRRLNEAMLRCGLQPHKKELLGRLSLGLQRRVALAEALLSAPAVLVLDDPFVGIDAAQRSTIANVIREVSTRSHVFISGHDPLLLKACCTRFVLIENARIVADDLDADTAMNRLLPEPLRKETEA